MLHLHRAERTDVLVDALGRLLRDQPEDAFVADVVAVPTRGMERWLSQRLSHHLGCDPNRGDGVCANVAFPFPSDLVAGVLSGMVGEEMLRWAPERLMWTVLDEIDQAEADDDQSLAVLRGYVAAGTPGSERRVLAATRAAEAFARYSADRPQMLLDWAAGRDTDGAGAALDTDLRWQPALYRRVRASIGGPGPGERLEELCRDIARRPGDVKLPSRLSVLGPTRLTVAELAVLASLASSRDVHLWLPHPSPAMWDQLSEVFDAVAGRYQRRRDDASPLRVRVPLLSGLGRDSLELQQRLVTMDVEARHEHHPVPARPPTLLGALQQTLAGDAITRGGDTTQGQASVQVHACHGPARQVEVLREIVVGLLADDPSLEPRDIVVMVPDVEQYAPLMSATFGLADPNADTDGTSGARHPGHRLRVRLADRSVRQTNPVLGVAADLIDLADGRLPAGQVLDLAGAEPVRRRFRFSDDDLDRLRSWIVATGIRWGLDDKHRERAGLVGVVENTWRAGLDRLLLGVAMSEDALPTTGGVLPLDDIGSQDVELVGRLAEYVDRLEAATTSLRGDKPLEAWVAALLDALDSLTDVAPRDDWQMLSARRALASLVAEPAGSRAPTRIGLGDVRSLLHDLLAGRPTRASFRTGDLTVCSLAPMRAVPHRVVCVVGLDDGAFPRVGTDDGDDVLARDPLVGERDPRSEDRQILLDTIHAATDTLVFLYTGADPRTNTRRPPCVPLGEVLDTLVEITGAAESDGRERARDRFVVRHPLQPFDPRNFVAGPLGVARPFSFDTKALAGAERAGGRRVQPPGLDALRLDPAPADREPDLTLDALVSFVEHPVKAFLRKRLGVSVAGADEDDVDDVLCVELDSLDQWAVADRLLAARLGGAEPGTATRAERARGLLPPGRAGDAVLAERAALVEEIVATFERESLPAPATVDVAVRLGAQTLAGSVPGVRGTTIVRVIVSSLAAKHRLRAWVQLLALTAAQPEQPWTSLVVGRRKDEAVTFRLGPIPTDVAVRNLERLADLYARGMCMPLPVPAKTAEAYARRRFEGKRQHASEIAARSEWAGRFGDSDDDAHTLVWGPSASFDSLRAVDVPGLDPGEEGSAFGVLARLVWQDLLAAEGGAA